MDRKTYDDYLAKFNARDYEGFLAYWDDDDVDVSVAGVSLKSKDQVRKFYAFLHDHVREEISVHKYISTDEMVAMEATVRITGLKTLTAQALAEQGLHGFLPLEAGQVVEIAQFIHYHLRNGAITKALCAIFQPGRT
ncbi:MAG TPA: nuclear transport factor 2 family protein [Solimonas sp.]|nr:nuclear transport factor 2 family protein [Solimonas sp.]